MLKVEELKNWEDGINQVVMGDCLEMMKKMPDKCVDLVITSPPYNAHRIFSNGKMIPRNDKVLKKYQDFSDDLSTENYFNWQKKVIYELLRITKKQIFYNIQMLSGNKEALFKLFGEFANKIKEVIIWDKINAEPAIQYGVLNSQYEFIVVFDGEDPIRRSFENAKFERGTMTNILRLGKNSENESNNSACFPSNLPKKILLNFSNENDLIFDPFMGSGTTARACMDLKRKFIGTELSEEYCKIWENRLRQQTLL